MGVVGLWQLLDPTGRPVRLETLEGKILAIDISIWLNQFVKGYRGSGGASVDNAHLVGLFQRVCKLLHYKIKPVFVFDGEAPALKYRTLASRKRRREDNNDTIRKATQKMLRTYVEQKLLGEANPKLPKIKPTRRGREDESLFKLPQHSMLIKEESEESMSDADITHNADLAAIKVDSEEFQSLPAEVQHEFLVALKERAKRGSLPVNELPVDSEDFSSFQTAHILKKNKLQAKIENLRKEMNDGLLRMASDADVRLLLRISSHQPVESSSTAVKDEKDSGDDEGKELTTKKPKVEELMETEEGSAHEGNKEKRVENFLVSQWLEGAQRGDEAHETLKKAVELVHDEPEVMSDSGGRVEEERLTNVSKLLLSAGGKVSAEGALCHLEPIVAKSANTAEGSEDSVASDALSLDVGHGSMVSASTTRVMQADEQFDEGSESKRTSDDEELPFPPERHFEDSADQSCNTDVLNADLEVSETGNSLFKMEETVDRSKSLEGETSLQSCKLTEVAEGLPVVKEVSFLGTTQSSLKSNNDIVLPHNISTCASKDQSRCNSNSMELAPVSAASLSDNPTDFHQALEIIKEQERRQSECLEDKDAAALPLLLNGEAEAAVGAKSPKSFNNDKSTRSQTTSDEMDVETNNNIGPKTAASQSTSQLNRVEAEVDMKLAKPAAATAAMSPETIQAKREQLNKQNLALQNEINRIQRQTSEITASMAEDCEELLKMFGVPVVKAPHEAEAQCAALEEAGLVQGVVTDDSDIFLFGGNTVYKNLFSQDHQCEMYAAQTIEANLKLSRDDLIGFAMLTGSDYTNGIENVGPVMACEILAEFRTGQGVLKTLSDFKEWWLRSQRGAVTPKNSIRTRFIKLVLDDPFPSKAVYGAYCQPTVSLVEENFSWLRPDLDLLRSFTSRKFNWPQDKTDGFLLPILKRFEDKSSQSRIDRFLLPAPQKRENLFPSKRLKAAVGKMRFQPQKEAKLSESSSDSE